MEATDLCTALEARSGHAMVVGRDAEAAEAFFARVAADLSCHRRIRVGAGSLEPAAVVRALGADVSNADPALSEDAIVRALVEDARGEGLPIVVVIAHADAVKPRWLEDLREIVESVPEARDIVRIVLLGGPRLIETLRLPDVQPLAARIVTHVRLPQPKEDIAPARSWRSIRTIGPLVVVVIGAVMLAVLRIGESPRRAAIPPVVEHPAAPVAVPRPAPPVPTPAVEPERAAPSPDAPQPTPSQAAPPQAAAPQPAPPQAAPPQATAPEPAPPQAAVPQPAPLHAAPPQTAAVEPAPPQTAAPQPAAPQAAAPRPTPPREAPPQAASPKPAPTQVASPKPAPSPSTPPHGPALQLGAFASADNAEALRQRLAPQFPAVYVVTVVRNGVTYHCVRVGG